MILKRNFFVLNDTVMRFFALMISKWDLSKTDNWKNVSHQYQFINLKFFHPEQRMFDWTDMRFLNTSIPRMIFDTKILRFEIAYFFNLAHASPDLNDLAHSRSKMCQVSCNWVLMKLTLLSQVQYWYINTKSKYL